MASTVVAKVAASLVLTGGVYVGALYGVAICVETYDRFIRSGGRQRCSLLSALSVASIGGIAGMAVGHMIPRTTFVGGVALAGCVVAAEVVERLS